MLNLDVIERLIERVRENTDWTTEIPNTDLHRARLIAESMIEALGTVGEAVEDRFVELPTDLNGMQIRVGDMMSTPSEPRRKLEVHSLHLDADGWRVTLLDEKGLHPMFTPLELVHYELPTLESVLRYFAERYSKQINIPPSWRVPVSDEILETCIDDIHRVLSDGEEEG